jgi:hypothetical protein
MKRFLLFAATLLMAVAVASPASALHFGIDGPNSSVDISNIWKKGLFVYDPVAALNPGLDDIGFDLHPGQSFTFDFFHITVGGKIGGGHADISATLAFEEPEKVSGSAEGEGSWFTFLGFISYGELHWTHQPEEIVLTEPNKDGIDSFSIVFSDIKEFGLGNKATVQATVTAGGAAPVPEPGTIMLMGIGLVGLARVGRRKIKA